MAPIGPKVAAWLEGKANAVAIVFGNVIDVESWRFRVPTLAMLLEQLAAVSQDLARGSISPRIMGIGAGFGVIATRLAVSPDVLGI